MTRKSPTACEACGARAPVIATGRPKDRAVRVVAAVLAQGWGYDHGWFCSLCIKAMSDDQRAQVRFGYTEVERLAKQRIQYRPIDSKKEAGLRRLRTDDAHSGAPLPWALELEDAKARERRKLEELKRAGRDHVGQKDEGSA